LLVLSLLFPLILTACDEAAPPTQGGAADVVRPARIATAQPASGTTVHEFPARTEAVQVVNLSFRVPGLLEDIPISEGDLVLNGAPLAALDDTNYALALREAEVTLTNARQDFARKEELVARNVVSQQAFDDALKAVDLAEVTVAKARHDLAYTRLEAPFDAIVSRRLVDSFTNVQAGQEIMRLQDVSEIRVVANIPEYLIALHAADSTPKLEAVFPFLGGRAFPLVFREISTEANDVAQTYRVSLGMPRPDDVTILPGMTATLRAHVSRPARNDQAVTIPPGALVPRQSSQATPGQDGGPQHGPFDVWTVEPETGAVQRRPVDIGRMDNDSVVILSGLSPGESVVTAGVHHLRDGMRVRPLPQD